MQKESNRPHWLLFLNSETIGNVQLHLYSEMDAKGTICFKIPAKLPGKRGIIRLVTSAHRLVQKDLSLIQVVF